MIALLSVQSSAQTIIHNAVFTSVCLSTGGGVQPLGRHPPHLDRHPMGRYPPPGQTPPWADTPHLGRHPPGQTPPQENYDDNNNRHFMTIHDCIGSLEFRQISQNFTCCTMQRMVIRTFMTRSNKNMWVRLHYGMWLYCTCRAKSGSPVIIMTCSKPVISLLLQGTTLSDNGW